MDLAWVDGWMDEWADRRTGGLMTKVGVGMEGKSCLAICFALRFSVLFFLFLFFG
jgi:hypothetical protein